MKWDQFTSIDSTFKNVLLTVSHGFNYVLRRFYEQLDCVFMGNSLFYSVLKSLEWPLELVVTNMFYLHMRMSYAESMIDTEVLTP